MESTYIQEKYHQKSMTFLYPILEIPRAWIAPKGVYMFFGTHSLEKGELSVLFDNTEDNFEDFERSRLLNNQYLKNCYQTDKGIVYVFDIEAFKRDLKFFMKGQYSKFSVKLKGIVLGFFGDKIDPFTPHKNKIHPCLFPDIYRELVASEYGVDPELLSEELCPIFDLEKETLYAKIVERCATV